jgi:UDP-glucose 4-epimerase
MILVSGGLGCIGSHTSRAPLDLGESVVLLAESPKTTRMVCMSEGCALRGSLSWPWPCRALSAVSGA